MKLRQQLLLLFLLTVCLPGVVGATSRTVKTSGGDFTSIISCLNASSAGDTCTVFVGSYAGGTVTTSGSAGSPITLIKNVGDVVTITSTVTVSSRSYLTFSGLGWTAGITGNGSTNHITITGNTFTGTATKFFNIPDGLGSNGADNVFTTNTITSTSTSTAPLLYVYGDRNRIESNTMSGGQGDCMELGGQNVIVRNNSCTGVDGASGEHIDFVQVIGAGTTPTLSYSLIEGNMEKNCTNDGGNCHFLIIRTGSGPIAETNIVRYNYYYNLNDSGAVSFGGSGDSVPNSRFYNNTAATGSKYAGNGGCASWQNAATGAAKNNICYNSTLGSTSWAPFYDFSAGGGAITSNGNLTFTTAYAGGFHAPYTSEATYASLHSVDPLFTDITTSAAITSSSPAYNAGVALTTVVAGDSGTGTSLKLTDAHYFQPGWAGTNGDWVCVTNVSNCGQISSIDYSTNIATLTGSLTRSVGDSVWLYKRSDGTATLIGTAPDVGSYEVSGSDVTVPVIVITAPTSSPTYATGTQALTTLAGTASDNVALSTVGCTNDRGGTITITGLGTWNASTIALASGVNVLTCTATDTSSNTANDVLTVTYTPTTSTAYYPVTVKADSPTAYYRFNEVSLSGGVGVLDSSGNGNNAVYGGDPSPTTNQPGLADTTDASYLLTLAISGYVATTNHGVLNPVGTASWSLETTIQPANEITTIWDVGFPMGLMGRSWLVSSRVNEVALFIAPTTHYLSIERCGTNVCTTVADTTGVKVGTNYHVVATYDGAILRLYVNNVLVNSTATSSTIEAVDAGTDTSTYVAGGDGAQEATSPYVGYQDDSLVYPTALSSQQVAAHHHSPRRLRTVKVR